MLHFPQLKSVLFSDCSITDKTIKALSFLHDTTKAEVTLLEPGPHHWKLTARNELYRQQHCQCIYWGWNQTWLRLPPLHKVLSSQDSHCSHTLSSYHLRDCAPCYRTDSNTVRRNGHHKSHLTEHTSNIHLIWPNNNNILLQPTVVLIPPPFQWQQVPKPALRVVTFPTLTLFK